MSKIVLFVCLVLLGTVYANTQVSVVNAQYDTTDSSSPALFVDLNDSWNVTTIQPQNLVGKADGSLNDILQASSYQTLPIYNFVIGKPLNVYLVNLANNPNPTPPFTPIYTVENFTFVENQSYSFIYVAPSNGDSSFSATASFPGDMLIPFEERPNPSPTGKALVRIANVAVSTYNTASMVVNVIGTEGVANRTVTVPFGEASDFLEYDGAVTLTLEFTLPLDPSTTVDRTLTVNTVVGATQVVYIRGDIGDFNHLGSLTQSVEFAFPAAPVAAPVAPPTAEPVSAPVADTPTAPVASTPTAPTTPTARTPVKRVSSAAQTVAQIAGVAALASLLF